MSETISYTQLTLSLEALLEIAVHASWASPDEDVQIRFLQWMANELQYQYGVDREDLTKAGFPEDTKEDKEESLEDGEEQEEALS
jgi:hypothetical protein